MPTIFISHATKEDGQFARRLANDLKRSGVQVWIAPESIRPGEDWVDAIDRGLSQSSHILIVLTPAAVKSKWVQIETNAAIALEREGRIQVIPLDVKPCTVPPLLSTYQMVSLRRDYEAGLKQLANILRVHGTASKPRPKTARPKTLQKPSYLDAEAALHYGFYLARYDTGDVDSVSFCQALYFLKGGDLFGFVSKVFEGRSLGLLTGSGRYTILRSEIEFRLGFTLISHRPFTFGNRYPSFHDFC